VREVWPDEAHDFTPWLAENPEHLSKALHMDSLRAEVYVDDGESTYPLLEAQRLRIEGECSRELQWEPLEDARASRVAVYLDPADPADRAKWPEYRGWAVKTLGELRRAFSGPIKDLPRAPCIGGFDIRSRVCSVVEANVGGIVGLIARAPWREAVTYRHSWMHEYVDDCVLNRARLYRDRRDFVIRSGDNGARED